MRLLTLNAVLSTGDQGYKDRILRPFFKERLTAYANAAEFARQRDRLAKLPFLRPLLARALPSRGSLFSRILERIH